jgi:hypothetical protein
MGTTTKHALRYPEPTDPADVPTDMNELATDVDNALPPVSVNGQWLKGGASGAMTWSAIAATDLAFAGQPNGVATLDATGKVPAAQIPAAAGAALVKIQDILLGTSGASFDFTSIPTTYLHLRAILSGRSDQAALFSGLNVRFNNDTVTGNYSSSLIVNTSASAAAAQEWPGTNAMIAGYIPGASANAGFQGAVTMDIPNYATAGLARTMNAAGGYATGLTTGLIWTRVAFAVWSGSVVVNRVTIFPSGSNFVAGSRCTLYGMA